MVDLQVNTLCLNTDYVLRTGPYDDPANNTVIQSQSPYTLADMQKAAVSRYNAVKVGHIITMVTDMMSLSYQEKIGEELLVSGSDDFTLFLWQPATNKRPMCRMTGN